MLKFCRLVLFSALVAVGAQRENINESSDDLMNQMNIRLRKEGKTSGPLPEIPLSSSVNYYGAIVLGYDSLKRTNDCWIEMDGQDATLDIHYGFEMLILVLPHLEFDGNNMSGYARIRDNSVHVSYTLHPASEKCVTLNVFQVEKIGNVEFGASRPEYDDINLDGLFNWVVKPTMNGLVNYYFKKIEDSLQALCKVKEIQNYHHVQNLVYTLL